MLCLRTSRLERRRERCLRRLRRSREAILDTGVVGVGSQFGTLPLCVHLHRGRSRRRRSGLVDQTTSSDPQALGIVRKLLTPFLEL